MRKGVKNMKEAETNSSELKESLYVTSKKLSSRQIIIYDDNEFPKNRNFLEVIELNNMSTSGFIKVKKIQMMRNCESSLAYSFRKCVEGYVVKVKAYCVN